MNFNNLFPLFLIFFLLMRPANTSAQNITSTDNHFQIVEYNNPDTIVDLSAGLWPHPLPMDYDHDGKIDLLISTVTSTPYNGIYFFKNISNNKNKLLFAKPVRVARGIKNIEISHVNEKSILMVPGAILKNFSQNFGTEKKIVFPKDSILKSITKARANQWKLVDYDNDSDMDIIVGIGDWGDYGWDNAFDSTGTWTKGALHGYVYFIENTNGNYINKGKLRTFDNRPIDVFGAPSPNFADFDGDGDLDLVCGSFLDKLTWFENIGTRKSPIYAKGRLLANVDGIITMPLEMMNVTAVDWDNDSDVDLIIGQEDGRVALLKNTDKVKIHMPIFESPVFFKQKPYYLDFGILPTPYGIDWDNDGKEDIIAGNSAGNIAFIKNLGGNPPKWAPPKLLEVNGQPIRLMAGYNGSIQGPAEAKWGYTTLSVADWNGDGLKDIIVNSIWGKIIWFENIGSKSAPKLSKSKPIEVDWKKNPSKPAWNWWNPDDKNLVTEWRTTPFAIDWNKDNLMDLIMLDHTGYLCFFERTKGKNGLILQPGEKIFYGRYFSGFNTNNKVTDSIPGPLQLNTGKFGSSGRRKFCIVDWDQNGKLDLLVNSLNVSLLKNIESKGKLTFFQNMGPLTSDTLAGHTTSPTIVDWDKNGIPDLLLGAEDGHFYYMVNPGSKN